MSPSRSPNEVTESSHDARREVEVRSLRRSYLACSQSESSRESQRVSKTNGFALNARCGIAVSLNRRNTFQVFWTLLFSVRGEPYTKPRREFQLRSLVFTQRQIWMLVL